MKEFNPYNQIAREILIKANFDTQNLKMDPSLVTEATKVAKTQEEFMTKYCELYLKQTGKIYKGRK